MPQYREINFNDRVLVKLTPDAIEALRRDHDELMAPHQERHPENDLFKFREPETDANGWSQFHFWEFVQKFGGHCGMGSPSLFVDNRVCVAINEATPDLARDDLGVVRRVQFAGDGLQLEVETVWGYVTLALEGIALRDSLAIWRCDAAETVGRTCVVSVGSAGVRFGRAREPRRSAVCDD